MTGLQSGLKCEMPVWLP